MLVPDNRWFVIIRSCNKLAFFKEELGRYYAMTDHWGILVFSRRNENCYHFLNMVDKYNYLLFTSTFLTNLRESLNMFYMRSIEWSYSPRSYSDQNVDAYDNSDKSD